MAYHKLYGSIKKQVDAFLEGFYDIIPRNLIQLFDNRELELLISGLPNIDSKSLVCKAYSNGFEGEYGVSELLSRLSSDKVAL
jgi:E3 ubiquitin-protein ligase HUWE1